MTISVGLELIRFTVVETDATHNPGHIVLAATIVLAVVVFALRMFSLIERAVPGTPTDLPPA